MKARPVTYLSLSPCQLVSKLFVGGLSWETDESRSN